MKTRLLLIPVILLILLFGVSFFITSGEGIFLPLRIFVDDLFSDYDDSVRKANYDATNVLDCNDSTNPYNEYECFRDAFSNCYNAIVNPEIYTIEGDPIYTTLRITPDCTIQGTADTSTDRFAIPEIITTECLSVGRGGHMWDVGSCDAENLPEMQFNLEMQLYPQILECEENGNTWNREKLECVVEFESFTLVEGTKIEIEGIIVNMRLDSAHQYSLFTNDPRFTFNTGSNGINLLGLHDENDLNGKIISLSGTRTQRDLGIHVNNYEIIDSLIPSYGTLNISNAKNILDVSIAEIYENPEKYYNRFVRVAGDLSEYENNIAYAGVGCDTAKYEISDEFSSDFPSSRHLQDGDKIIGVRIGAHDDLGKVKEPLPDELKSNKVTVMGILVPSVVERGSCYHTIHKSGYILTEFDRIKIL